jgi:hypothetical protein
VAPTGSQASAYTCTMVTGSAAATITGTAAATSRVSVDGGAASTNTAQKSLNPTPGTSAATRFTVTSESGVSRTVDVTLSEEDDNTLSKLSIPGCSVNLTGSIATTITCAAPYGTTSVTLSATATSTASKLSVNSGASSASNTISSVLTTGTAGAPASRHTVLVQPSIGATRTYVINISRQAPDTRTDVDYVTYSWPGGSVQVPQETGTQMGNFFGRIPAGISSITVTPHTVSPVATVSNLTSPISISMHGASGQGSMNVTSESGAVQTFYIEPYREFSNLKSLLVSDGWIVSAANAAKAFTEDDYEYILYVQTDDQASVNLTFGAINPGAQIVIYTATSSGTIIGAPNQTLTIPVPPFVDSELYIHIAEGGGSTVYHFAIRL